MNKDERTRKLKRLRAYGQKIARAKRMKIEAGRIEKKYSDKIRELATELGFKESREKVTLASKDADSQPQYLRFNFPESTVIDEDRLKAWLQENEPALAKKIFKKVTTVHFDKALFLKLEESGAIKKSDRLYRGKDPIIYLEDGTVSIYVDDKP